MRRLATAILLTITLSPAAVAAAPIVTSDQFMLPAGEIIDGNLYIGAGTANILGRVLGDLYAAAGTMMVAGQVTEDLTVAGGNTTVAGLVVGDLRVIGGQTTITGTVAGDIFMIGGSLSVLGQVEGDVDFIGGRLLIDENAAIGGDVTYRSDRRAEISPAATITGRIIYDQTLAEKLGVLKDTSAASFKSNILALFGAWLFLKLAMLVFAALVIYWLLPEALFRVTAETGRRFGWSFLIGFAALAAVPVFSVILLVTIIGLPLAVAVFGFYLVLLIGAKLMTGPALGAWLDRRFFNRADYRLNWQTVLGGTVLFFLLGYLPFLGWLFNLALVAAVFGAMLQILYRRWLT